MNRKNWLIGNWKMNGSAALLRESASALNPLKHMDVNIALLLPASLWSVAHEVLQIPFGAQNLFYEKAGAFTGELSTEMLKEWGGSLVCVGHSERRNLMNESQKIVAKKIVCALNHGLTPILCVGETLCQREQGLEKETVKEQLKSALDDLPKSEENYIVAYEPVWAIGTGKAASLETVAEMVSVIRSEISESTPLLYGGSVNPHNAAELMSIDDVDGFLVGGVSLKVDEFIEVYNQC